MIPLDSPDNAIVPPGSDAAADSDAEDLLARLTQILGHGSRATLEPEAAVVAGAHPEPAVP